MGQIPRRNSSELGRCTRVDPVSSRCGCLFAMISICARILSPILSYTSPSSRSIVISQRGLFSSLATPVAYLSAILCGRTECLWPGIHLRVRSRPSSRNSCVIRVNSVMPGCIRAVCTQRSSRSCPCSSLWRTCRLSTVMIMESRLRFFHLLLFVESVLTKFAPSTTPTSSEWFEAHVFFIGQQETLQASEPSKSSSALLQYTMA